MAINNINNNVNKPPIDANRASGQANGNNSTVAQQQASVAARVSVPQQDSVSLTQSAQQLNQVQKKSAEAPVNQEKVDRLKKSIQSGEYRVDPEGLAKKIARLEAEVFGVKGN